VGSDSHWAIWGYGLFHRIEPGRLAAHLRGRATLPFMWTGNFGQIVLGESYWGVARFWTAYGKAGALWPTDQIKEQAPFQAAQQMGLRRVLSFVWGGTAARGSRRFLRPGERLKGHNTTLHSAMPDAALFR
jgi:hypothetical protein